MNFFEALLLGVIQGLTEFLPVSSSGHLAVAQWFFGVENSSLTFAIILHLGTFLAIVIAYWRSVVNMIKEFFLMLGDLFRGRGFGFKDHKYRKYIALLVVASIPAGIVGVLFSDYIDSAFSSIYFVCAAFVVTGFILLFGSRLAKKNNGELSELSYPKAFGVGLFQMCAVLPGISRSGTTTVGGMSMGLKKEDALELSFLMALPAILGSLLLELKDVLGTVADISLPICAVGFFAAFIVGLFSIWLYRKIVINGSTLIFSIYLWVLAAVVLYFAVSGTTMVGVAIICS